MARGATSISYTAKSVRRQPTFSPLDKSRRVFLLSFLSLIALASACAIFYIGTHIQAVNLGYDIGQELQRKESLIEENKRLNLEIARLKSPTRIETEAKETLGLTLPKTQQVFYLSRLEDDSLLRIPGAVPVETKPDKAKVKAAAPAVATVSPSKTEKSPAPVTKPAAVKISAPTLAKAETIKTKPASAEVAKAEPPLPKPAKPGAASVKAAPKEKVVALQEKSHQVPEKKSDLPAIKPSAPKLGQPSATKTAATAKPETPTKLAKSEPAIKLETATKKSDLFKNQKLGKPEKTLAMKNPGNGSEAKPALFSDVPIKSLAQKEKPGPAAKKSEGMKSETAKNDIAKTPVPKSSAKEKIADTRIAKGEETDVLVAKIVSRESSREKPVTKLKTGNIQGKDKVPAVMLDNMP